MTDKQLNKKFISMLEPKPKEGFMDNGEGYILQDPDIVNEIRKYFLDKYNSYFVAGRSLSDSNSPLYDAFMRLYAIDKSYKEWDQIYFANNSNEGKQICFNPEFEKILLKKKRKQKLNQIEKQIKIFQKKECLSIRQKSPKINSYVLRHKKSSLIKKLKRHKNWVNRSNALIKKINPINF